MDRYCDKEVEDWCVLSLTKSCEHALLVWKVLAALRSRRLSRFRYYFSFLIFFDNIYQLYLNIIICFSPGRWINVIEDFGDCFITRVFEVLNGKIKFGSTISTEPLYVKFGNLCNFKSDLAVFYAFNIVKICLS